MPRGGFLTARKWFENHPGVRGVRPGYTGGWLHNPTGVHVALDFTGMWQCVVSHTSCVHTARTGHAMAVEVTYDPAEVSYGDLCQLFSNNRNPNLNTAEHRKQAWNGSMFRTRIFYSGAEEKRVAEYWTSQSKEMYFIGVEEASRFWPCPADDIFFTPVD